MVWFLITLCLKFWIALRSPLSVLWNSNDTVSFLVQKEGATQNILVVTFWLNNYTATDKCTHFSYVCMFVPGMSTLYKSVSWGPEEKCQMPKWVHLTKRLHIWVLTVIIVLTVDWSLAGKNLEMRHSFIHTAALMYNNVSCRSKSSY